MNITGPIQPNYNQTVEKNELFLKVNQRVAGEILNVANDQVVLSINGVQVVARMTSSEQLAMLMEKRYAYFVVKDVTDKVVTLQLANIEKGTPAKQALLSDLNSSLLEQVGLPVNQENLSIVQAALSKGLKITPELILEMRETLETIPNWGEHQAQLAASIKAAGLPLTNGSLSLAENAIKNLQESYSTLLNQLETALYKTDLSEAAYRLIRAAINSLKEVIIQGGDSKPLIENELLNSIKFLGTSIENDLAKLSNPELRESVADRLSNSLLTLSNLRREVSGSGNNRLMNAIDTFTEGMKWTHFLNSEVDHSPGKGLWTQLDLPLSFGSQNVFQRQAEDLHNLKIRIAQEGNPEGGMLINPDYTRLVIQVDLNDHDMIRVDLSIVSKQIGAEITASNNDICLLASEELSDFQTGLTNLGYTLKTSRIETGHSTLEMDMNESKGMKYSFSSVDLGV